MSTLPKVPLELSPPQRRGVPTRPTWLTRLALVVVALFAAFGLLFALGYAFEDPGGWAGVGITAAVVLPLAGLTLLAARWPRVAYPTLIAGVGLLAAWAGLTVLVNPVEAPVTPVVAVMLTVPLAVLGQHRPLPAGVLMLAVAAVPFARVLIGMLAEPRGDRPGILAVLGGSSGVVVVPILLFALLFLVSGLVIRGHAAHASAGQATLNR